jgi:serine protease
MRAICMRKLTIAPLLCLLLYPAIAFVQGTRWEQPRQQFFHLPEDLTQDDYWDKKVVFKVKDEFRSYCSENNVSLPILSRYKDRLGVTSLHKSFPRSTAPSEPVNALGERMADLSLIYELQYSNPVGIEEAINFLLQTGIADYAEPSYVYKPFYDPNDPDTAQQYALAIINARAAWDISRGDSTIKIGIVDTGGSFFHPDYAPKIAKNWADPIDGIDNDNNGYLDDFQGWDFGGDYWNSPGDNLPQWAGIASGSDHGVIVGGAAAAATDNGINIAAIGFDCSLLVVKVSIDESPLIYYGYQGVVYAADMGAQIINLSWGGGGSDCRMCDEAIRYAAINRGSLVVAAAGNTPAYINFYPASFPLALSVPGTQQNDAYWFSNANFGTTWSYFADVCAPSRDILTATTDAGTYSATGTSLGAPIVCGIAGLVKDAFPSLNMRQVGQMVRMGADENIYPLNSNNHAEQMGKGRSDALGALTYIGPAVRAVDVLLDTDDGLIQPGDTVDVRVRFANFLDPVTNLQIDVTTPNFGQFEIVQGSAFAGDVGTLDTVSTWVCPFKVVVRPSTTPGFLGYLRFGYQGTGYTDFEYWGIRVQPTYVNLNANRLATSVDGKGRWGFTNFPALSNGTGLDVDGVGSLMNDAGFLIGTDAGHVSNNIENQAGSADNHFVNTLPIVRMEGGEKADLEAITAFTDAGAGGNALGVTIGQHSYQWSMEGDDAYIIQEYTIKNTGGSALNGVYAGMYFDLDGFWRSQNRSKYDTLSRTIYNIDTTWVTLWDIGISLLTPDSLRGFAADVNSFSYNIADKWNALSSPPQGAKLGPLNLAQWAGAGPFNIAAGDSHIVAFAIVLGDSVIGMRNARQAAYDKYWCVVRNGMNPQTDLGPDVYQCGNTNPITLDAGPGYSSYLWNTGAITQTISATDGDWWVKTSDVNGCEDYDRIEIVMDPGVTSSFTHAPTTIFVGDTVTFTSTTVGAIEWCWNWGDGSTDCPILSSASHVFTQYGTYNVCLTTGNGTCEDTTCMTILVDTLVGTMDAMAGRLEVFPVPAREQVRVRLENAAQGKVELVLFDLAGRQLLSNSFQKNGQLLEVNLDLGVIPAGMYILEMRDESGRKTKRVLVE